MKKRAPSPALALGLCALLFLSACGKQPGNTGPEPPIYGFYDTVTQTTFLLGDPKEKFDEAFGEPEVYTRIGETHIYFEDKSLNVIYNKDNNASSFFSMLTKDLLPTYSPPLSSTASNSTAASSSASPAKPH